MACRSGHEYVAEDDDLIELFALELGQREGDGADVFVDVGGQSQSHASPQSGSPIRMNAAQ